MLKYIDLKMKANKTEEYEDTLNERESQLSRLNEMSSYLHLQAGINDQDNPFDSFTLLTEHINTRDV